MIFKLKYKITVLIVLIITLLFSGIYIYLNKYLTDRIYNRIRSDLVREFKLAETYLFESLGDSLDIKSVDAVADEIGKDLGLRVTIIARDGVVLGDSGLTLEEVYKIENHLYRPEIQEALKNKLGESRRLSSTVKKEMLYSAQVFDSANMSGVIRFAIPLSEIREVTGDLRRSLFFIFIMAFLILIPLSSFVAGLIARPISEMSALTKEIASGDFKNKVRVSTNDEIGDLAGSINFMSEQIKSKIEEVTRNQSRQEAVLLSMFEGLMVADESGRIILMNQRLKDFLRVTQEPLGRKPLEVIRNIEIQDLTDKALLIERGVESKEITVHLPEEKILKIHATPVIREGRTDGAVLVFHDITELKRLENIRRDFVANVSHELRTPLTSIKGYAETLLEGALDDKKNAREFIEIIHTDAGRLANLVDDLLDLAKIESGKLELDLKAHSVENVVDKVFVALANAAKTKPVKLLKEIPTGLPKALMDEPSIAQLLLNLVDNAIKYNKINGTVTVAASVEGAYVRVSVKDTGIGIPPEDLPRIFERFYRVDKARSREMGGTGLGLSIVKHIIQAHHGEVFVESTLTEGSTFSFTLAKA